ncbi:hypothetical protein L2E82_30054 [Cichorium intybus]|uniref:Uncharacterized protein n=2 Tax=Cichorium intybus TaxID=13427 RepID=A0ACB9CZ90_CICIN|nr:hypothetical protein L2E82_29319 [Cichorium intybus]KAI3739644.1 hypothetical protein L2E82_30054 [Cichorium intybus]
MSSLLSLSHGFSRQRVEVEAETEAEAAGEAETSDGSPPLDPLAVGVLYAQVGKMVLGFGPPAVSFKKQEWGDENEWRRKEDK